MTPAVPSQVQVTEVHDKATESVTVHLAPLLAVNITR